MTIKKVSGGEIVVSHTGKRLTKPKSHAGAVKDLRRIEYFKHHAKCIVDPSLVKAEIGSEMHQYSPVIFQTKGNQKKNEVEADKKDFPSTAKAFDLKDLQRDFPSSPEHGQVISNAFSNPRAGEKSWNGPDIQMKGSDYIQSHVNTTKSVTIAGRKVRLIKGSEGSDNGNLGGYPIDAAEEAEKRKAANRVVATKDKMAEHENNKKYRTVIDLASSPEGYLGRSKDSGKIGEYSVESPDRTKVYKRADIDPNKPHTVSLIHYSPEAIAKREKRAKQKLSLKSKTLGNIILQYTQNQPLAASLKPLIAYLVKKGDEDEKKETEKAMTTSQIAEKIGKPKTTVPSSASRIRLMERAAKEKTEQSSEEDAGPHPDFGTHGGYKGDTTKLGKGHPNPIDGGIGDDLEYKDVDPKELEAGIEVEQEHVGNDPNIDDEEKRVKGADIAMDHLKEDDKYYSRLADMERSSKEEQKSETQKKKLLAIDEVGKSVIKERKLAGTVANAEKMVGIREAAGASQSEMKTTRGQLKAYTKKLKAEREKNNDLVVKALLREERDSSSKAYKKLQREEKVKDRTPKPYEQREKMHND
jgi:hypothetical protein